MSMVRMCDICGRASDTYSFGTLIVHNFNDGYNTESYDIQLDICEECLNEKLGRENLEKGREF